MDMPLLVKLDVESATLEHRLLNHMQSYPEAQVMPANGQGHDILALEIRRDVREVASVMAAERRGNPEGEIFLFTQDVTHEAILEAMRQGAREILPNNCSGEMFHQALARHLGRMRQREKAQERRRLGKIISVVGSKGGVGTTTTAVNLGRELARRSWEQGLALVDLDLPYGDMSAFTRLEAPQWTSLSLEGNATLNASAVLRAAPRLDWGSTAILFPDILRFVGDGFSLSSLYTIVSGLREHFDLLVVDLGSELDETRKDVLRLSSSILFVGMQSVPCVARMRRFYNDAWLRDDTAARTSIVINRAVKYSDISAEDVQNAVGHRVFWQLPEDYAGTLAAINLGSPLREVSPRSPVCKSFEKLAEALLATSAYENHHAGSGAAMNRNGYT